MKCFKCKGESEKESMICIEKSTGNFNKNGTEKKIRKYFHNDCYQEFLHEQEIKQQDLKELDDLYKYLVNLHSLTVLDGRMMEKIQDLRNGSIKINGKKIKKYKQGVQFSKMLDTYKYLSEKIDYILRSMQFQAKWNEFSYVFGTVVNNLNSMNELEKANKQANNLPRINQETVDIEIRKTIKKDDLDISAFL
jgi:hypothetical protein